jgi:hypothetical protein
MGKIGVLVALESTGKKDELANFGRMLAMHVAATNPVALTLEAVPADVLARESAILEEKNAGKPANVLEKIVASGLKTFAKENCLLEQAYVHDGSKTVTQALAEVAKAAGAEVKLTGFARMQLGEGIEKKEDDFAAEVAKGGNLGQQPAERPRMPLRYGAAQRQVLHLRTIADAGGQAAAPRLRDLAGKPQPRRTPAQHRVHPVDQVGWPDLLIATRDDELGERGLQQGMLLRR